MPNEAPTGHFDAGSVTVDDRYRLLLMTPDLSDDRILVSIYQFIQTEKLMNWLFWNEQSVRHEDRGGIKSLMDFCIENPLMIVTDLDNLSDGLTGVIWWTRVIEKHQAFISVAYARAMTKDAKARCTQEAIRWGFATQGWNQVWADTPWPWVVRHAKRFGATVAAKLPNFTEARGKMYPMYILRYGSDDERG